jgi:uncharacterized alpha/beta hydrolase family protein
MKRVVISLIISFAFTLILSYISIKHKNLEAKKDSSESDNKNKDYIHFNLYTILNFVMISLFIYMIVP